MKARTLYLFVALACLLTACKVSYPVAQQSGKEDMAYLVFVGPKDTSRSGGY